MKKLLALVLALVMTLSLAVVGSNAAFKDADKVNETYSEAVNVLSGMKVFQGYTDGSFQPTGDITRAEVAAIVYRLYTGDVTDKQASLYATYNKFSDMDGAKWAAGYIGYCANAGLVKGYDAKTFGPADKVTGYQALAMILRAVGYDAQGEFTGADWQLHVAQTAQQAGVLQNVKGVDLNAAATRELVAELLFRTAAKVPMVKYTPAFGYVANSVVGAQKTLGEQNFDLKLSTTSNADAFGRPANVWTYNTGDKKTTVVAKAVATYTTKVDECDIAKDLGITKNTSIEKAFIDGIEVANTSDKVTSNRYASINPLATTSYVGAQGRLTEVYDMGTAGYRIVEVNTYLATINKVVPAYTDRNTHSTLDTVNLTALIASGDSDSFKGVVASGFTVDQYVLVTISKVGTKDAAVESVVAATVAEGGTLTGWTNAVGTTPATSVVGTTTYNDADKFVLNRRTNGNWMVITDTYGNVIGLTATATNYLVIEKIEWKSDAANIGGYAMADLKLADGTEVKGATIATVNSKTANSAANYASGDVNNGWVSYYYSNNTSYYNHLFTYSVNANGSYNVVPHGSSPLIGDVTGKTGTIVNGQATINTNTNTYVATNSTVFLVKNLTDGYSYTVYTGKDNVPSVTGANLCVLTNTNGYATLVVVSDYTLAANTFYAYVTNNAQDGWYKDPVKGYAYTIYKAGETTPTTVYAANQSDWTYNTTHETGLYSFTVNADNQITSMTCVICDLHCTSSLANIMTGWDRSSVKAGVLDGSFQTIGYSAVVLDKDNDNGYKVTTTSAVKDFNVTDETKYVVVTKNALTGSSAVLTAGDKGDLTAGSVVLVNYTAVGTKYTAKTVYILKVTGNGVNNPALTYTISGTPVVAGTTGNITVTGLTFNYEDKTATVNPGKGGTISVALYKHNNNGYDTIPYTVLNSTMPGSVITGGTWTLNKTIPVTLATGQYYANVTVTMADGTTSTYNTIYFSVV